MQKSCLATQSAKGTGPETATREKWRKTGVAGEIGHCVHRDGGEAVEDASGGEVVDVVAA